jgi:hypothetical protein
MRIRIVVVGAVTACAIVFTPSALAWHPERGGRHGRGHAAEHNCSFWNSIPGANGGGS